MCLFFNKIPQKFFETMQSSPLLNDVPSKWQAISYESKEKVAMDLSDNISDDASLMSAFITRRKTLNQSLHITNLDIGDIESDLSRHFQDCSSFSFIGPSLSLFLEQWGSLVTPRKEDTFVIPNPESPIIKLMHPTPDTLKKQIQQFISGNALKCSVYTTDKVFYQSLYLFEYSDNNENKVQYHLYVTRFHYMRRSRDSKQEYLFTQFGNSPISEYVADLVSNYKSEMKEMMSDATIVQYPFATHNDIKAINNLMTLEGREWLLKESNLKSLSPRAVIKMRIQAIERQSSLTVERIKELGFKMYLPKRHFLNVFYSELGKQFGYYRENLRKKQMLELIESFPNSISNLMPKVLKFHISSDEEIASKIANLLLEIKFDGVPYFHGTTSDYAASILTDGPICRAGQSSSDFGSGFYLAEKYETALLFADSEANRFGVIFCYSVEREVNLTTIPNYETSHLQLSFDRDAHINNMVLYTQNIEYEQGYYYGPTSNENERLIENNLNSDLELGNQICFKSDNAFNSSCKLIAMIFIEYKR